MTRTPLIVGNWKMFKTASEARASIQALLPLIASSPRQVFIAPPFTAIAAAVESAKGSRLGIGAQNMHDASEGAFTGEVSAAMLKDLGASFVILGHSERRSHFLESNAFIYRKVERALEAKLIPILCIGETQEQRDRNQTLSVLQTQLKECLGGISDLSSVIIAYEPIWAIGTGKTATPAMAQEVHRACRQLIEQEWGKGLAQQIRLLYGGSVKADNISTLMKEPDIDGVLVGGASLDPKGFAQIICYQSLEG